MIPVAGFQRVTLAAPRGPRLRDPRRHRVRRGDPRLRRSAPAARLDRRGLRRRLHAAARARLGALGRGVGRRGARGRALRRRDRRALRGRVEVLPAHAARRRRRCSGSSGCSRRPAASGCSTCSGRRRICSRSARSRCRGRSTTGCWTRRSRCRTRSSAEAHSASARRVRLSESRPMSFVSPITNSSSTSPIPTIETRS